MMKKWKNLIDISDNIIPRLKKEKRELKKKIKITEKIDDRLLIQDEIIEI